LGKNLSTTPSCPELVEKELKGRKGWRTTLPSCQS
jgi:hypothetical protein